MRICTQCHQEKPAAEFRKRRANCKGCDVKAHAVWREANRDHVRKYERLRWKKTDRWDKHIARRYGLTVEEYTNMLNEQGGGCAICKSVKAGGNSERFHVDHDHATGKVRGLLCSRCNRMIGQAEDDVVVLESAAAYLRKAMT